MVGLPGHKMIPNGWSAHHQKSVQTAMRGTVDVLKRPSELPGPPPIGQPEQPHNPVHTSAVEARIRALGPGDGLAPSQQMNENQDYLVQIPADAVPELVIGSDGHTLVITSSPNTPWLVGRRMSIESESAGTEAFNRDLICRIHVTQAQKNVGG